LVIKNQLAVGIIITLQNVFAEMPDDDFIYVKTRKRSRRNTDTTEKVLVATSSESHKLKFIKETDIR
jgi:hypothetical protein